jgi:GNAT superfamily N-acetyltransferase
VLIQAGGQTAGYCLYRPEEGRNNGRPGVYLRQYYIKPPFRQHGLGRAALNRIMAEYMADAAFVELDVLECNATGRAFWARAGFAPVYRRLIRRG